MQLHWNVAVIRPPSLLNWGHTCTVRWGGTFSEVSESAGRTCIDRFCTREEGSIFPKGYHWGYRKSLRMCGKVTVTLWPVYCESGDSLGASPFTSKKKCLVHFALPTSFSHPTGTVGRQLSVKASFWHIALIKDVSNSTPRQVPSIN